MKQAPLAGLRCRPGDSSGMESGVLEIVNGPLLTLERRFSSVCPLNRLRYPWPAAGAVNSATGARHKG